MNEYRIALVEAYAVLKLCDELLGVLFEPAVNLLLQPTLNGGKILTCGNGAAALTAAALASDLMVRYKSDRNPIAAICVASGASILTATGTDYGYGQVFSRQVTALGRPGDVLVAFSPGGRDDNVTEAIHTAKAIGMGTLGLSGCKGMIAGPDVDLHVATFINPRIQEAHVLLSHILVEELERRIPQ